MYPGIICTGMYQVRVPGRPAAEVKGSFAPSFDSRGMVCDPSALYLTMCIYKGRKRKRHNSTRASG